MEWWKKNENELRRFIIKYSGGVDVPAGLIQIHRVRKDNTFHHFLHSFVNYFFQSLFICVHSFQRKSWIFSMCPLKASLLHRAGILIAMATATLNVQTSKSDNVKLAQMNILCTAPSYFSKTNTWNQSISKANAIKHEQQTFYNSARNLCMFAA